MLDDKQDTVKEDIQKERSVSYLQKLCMYMWDKKEDQIAEFMA